MADPTDLPWWRIEIDSDGLVTSCKRVDSAGKKDLSVFYVQAASESEAQKLSWNAYALANGRRRRARLISEGKCTYCARPNDREASKRCTSCLSKLRDRRPPKSNLRRPGAHARATQPSTSARSELQPERLAVLIEVREAWLRNNTVGSFSAWLNREIDSISGKAVA